MNAALHLPIVTTLSMMMTLFLHCTLKDTSAIGLLVQDTYINRISDSLLYARCLVNNDTDHSSCSYILRNENFGQTCLTSVLAIVIVIFQSWLCADEISCYCESVVITIIGAWFLARFCDAFDVVYPVDVFTVYFLLWQFMFIKVRWDYERLPLLSINLYRASICWLMASTAFFTHDLFFRYLPKTVALALLWIDAVFDTVTCLHPEGFLRKEAMFPQVSDDVLPPRLALYFTEHEDNDGSQLNTEDNGESLGLADFVIYNLTLLWILPPVSSVSTKVAIAVGHIIAVQIGLDVTDRLGRLYSQMVYPAVPLPVLCATLYAFLLSSTTG